MAGLDSFLGPETIVSEFLEEETFVEEDLAQVTSRAFTEANREMWDNPEEDAAWADW